MNHQLLIGTDSLAWISTQHYRDICKIQSSHRCCDKTKGERGVRAQLSHLTATPHHIGRPTATLGAAAQEMVENVYCQYENQATLTADCSVCCDRLLPPKAFPVGT